MNDVEARQAMEDRKAASVNHDIKQLVRSVKHYYSPDLVPKSLGEHIEALALEFDAHVETQKELIRLGLK